VVASVAGPMTWQAQLRQAVGDDVASGGVVVPVTGRVLKQRLVDGGDVVVKRDSEGELAAYMWKSAKLGKLIMCYFWM
jgi:hypothetical protein